MHGAFGRNALGFVSSTIAAEAVLTVLQTNVIPPSAVRSAICRIVRGWKVASIVWHRSDSTGAVGKTADISWLQPGAVQRPCDGQPRDRQHRSRPTRRVAATVC